MTEPLELDALLYGDDETDRRDPATDIPSAEIDPAASLANWHMRKIVVIEAQAELDDERYKTAIAHLTARRKATAASHEKAADWHKVPLRQWHRREKAAGRLTGKKLALPAGTAQLRAAKKIDITDEDKLRAFLDTVPDEDGQPWSKRVWRTTEEYLVSELGRAGKVPTKKGGREPGSVANLVTADGVDIPGVRAIILPDTWTVSAR